MRRPLPILLALVLTTLVLAACGDSDGDGETADATTTAPATSSAPATSAPADDGTDSSGGSIDDAFADQLVALGFEEDEATCLAGELLEDGLDASVLAEIAEDPGQLLGAIQACDVPISRLLEIAGNLGTISSDPSDVLEQAIVQAFGSDVVSAEQAQCIADELLGQGRDVTALADLGSLGPILEGCGVSLSDIGG
jgi:hypothetical protein